MQEENTKVQVEPAKFQVVTRKIKVNIIPNEVELKKKKYENFSKEDRLELIKYQYEFLRNSIYAQYRGLNIAMGRKVAAIYNAGLDLKSDEFKTFLKEYKFNLKNPDFQDLNFGAGIDTLSAIKQITDTGFKKAIKSGFLKGEVRAPFYKRNYPLQIRSRSIKLSYNEKDNIIITTTFGGGISFFCDLGYKKNSIELRHTLHKVISGEVEIAGSSLEITDKNEWFINLAIKLPIVKKEQVEGRVLGIDVGITIPAYVAINDMPHVKQGYGCFEELAKVKMQFKERRRRLQRQLTLAKGGKGRKDKLKHLDRLKDKERMFTKTYNHQLSKKIVEFAAKNQCSTIHLENLNSRNMDSVLVSNWAYYELHTMIDYKANQIGIEVKKVDAKYTTSTCSKCGHVDSESVQKGQEFICTDCKYKTSKQYNAAINISNSTKFVKE